MKLRIKNVYFWLGLIALFLTSTGIEASDLTSWAIVYDKIVAVMLNPYRIGLFVVAFVGQYINPSTKGLKD